MASHREVKLYSQVLTAFSVTWLITLQQATWPSFTHSLKMKTTTLCWIQAFWSSGSYSFSHCKQQLWVLASPCACGSYTSSLGFITRVGLQQFYLQDPAYPHVAWHKALENGVGFGYVLHMKWYRSYSDDWHSYWKDRRWRWMQFKFLGWWSGCYPNSNSKICIFTWSMPTKVLKTNLISWWKNTKPVVVHSFLSNINKTFKCFSAWFPDIRDQYF